MRATLSAALTATIVLALALPISGVRGTLGAASTPTSTPPIPTQVAVLQKQVVALQTVVAQLRKAHGPAGPRGSRGSQGSQGLAGTQGAQGPPGLRGATGLQGTVGLSGAQGLSGPQGLPGLPGLPGLQGAQGPQGQQGPQGVPGPPGPTAVPSTPAPTNTPYVLNLPTSTGATLGSGQTISGDVAYSFTATTLGSAGGTLIPFRLPLGTTPSSALVQGQGGCTAPGVAPINTLCLYPSRQVNVQSVLTTANDSYNATPTPNTADRNGFYFQITAGNYGLSLWQGTYTYTAP